MIRKSQILNIDCLEFLRQIESNSVQLIVTSPPYNIGKEYEKRIEFGKYLESITNVIEECTRVLKDSGSIFWQVGTYVDNNEVYPLDMFFYPIFKRLGLKLRNRVVWSFGHGLNCKRRFSGRHETILWFTKSDDYTFNLDSVRVPQLYPNKKAYKGPNKGKLSCNPLGKNPSDVWNISNVKHMSPEKTEHPCQFPEAMIERIVKVASNENDLVLDPFAGSGTSIVVAKKLNRFGIGCDIEKKYVLIASKRLKSN